jgi:hypothetical protein
MIGYFIFVFIEYILTENKIICKAKWRYVGSGDVLWGLFFRPK